MVLEVVLVSNPFATLLKAKDLDPLDGGQSNTSTAHSHLKARPTHPSLQ